MTFLSLVFGITVSSVSLLPTTQSELLKSVD